MEQQTKEWLREFTKDLPQVRFTGRKYLQDELAKLKQVEDRKTKEIE